MTPVGASTPPHYNTMNSSTTPLHYDAMSAASPLHYDVMMPAAVQADPETAVSPPNYDTMVAPANPVRQQGRAVTAARGRTYVNSHDSELVGFGFEAASDDDARSAAADVDADSERVDDEYIAVDASSA
eukprot:m.172056 g.172056  ORF g.172056 m.172056 type:complete len:129 (-) comp17851_c0_seq1:114-500(-)